MSIIDRIKRKLFPRKAYVVIYDVDTGVPDFGEQYYGYFSSVKEARARYAELSQGQGYYNAKICLIVENVEEEQ